MEENQTEIETTETKNQSETNEESIIQTNDNTVINTDSSSDNETVESPKLPKPTKPTKQPKPPKLPKPTKQQKSPKSQFKEDCNHCSKSFKSKLTYDKHVLQQLCYKQDEITYCKICCITLINHNQYKKHLFTMEHLNNIGYNNIERLQNKEVSKIHLADPYLNKNDVNKIATTNLGDSFTFVFNIGNTKTVSLVNPNNSQSESQPVPNSHSHPHPDPHPDPQSQSVQPLQITNENQNTTTLDTNNTPQESKLQEHKHQEPTIRQQKIISYLEKQSIENTNPSDSGKRFYKMLDNSLQLEDYKGLQNIISNINIPFVFKDTYLKVVEIFITMLVKEKTKGEKLYKDKDISQLVINLSS